MVFSYLVFSKYSSDNNLSNIKENRKNLNKKLFNNSADLPFLRNDTDNAVNFNTGYNNMDTTSPKRNFWDLFKKKWKKKQ